MSFSKSKTDKYGSFIILAAGIGQRSGQDIPKTLLKIENKPNFIILLDLLTQISWIKNIILVVGQPWQDTYKKYINNFYPQAKNINICVGSNSRFGSLQQALRFLKPSSNPEHFILVHDCARILLATDLLHFMWGKVKPHQALAPATIVGDLIRRKLANGYEVINSPVWAMQTPQIFPAIWAQQYFLHKSLNNLDFRDEIEVIEHFGLKYEIVEGQRSNIKLTFAEDWHIIKKLLAAD